MHRIKKYLNRKLYDTTDKQYISLDDLSGLLKSGKEVIITDNETGEDLTASIVSRLIARKKEGEEKSVSSGVLIQLFRKGGGALTDYAKKYVSIWQSALTMAEDEVDRLVNMLIKNKEISKSEGKRLKRDITGYTDSFKRWISDNVDRRINEVLDVMNLATKDQLYDLAGRMDKLEKKMRKLEKLQKTKTRAKK